jgi:hypothetical protein
MVVSSCPSSDQIADVSWMQWNLSGVHLHRRLAWRAFLSTVGPTFPLFSLHLSSYSAIIVWHLRIKEFGN